MRRLLIALGALALVALAAWLITNLTTDDSPAALWTEADLPVPPDSAVNGWTLLNEDAARGDLAELSNISQLVQQALQQTESEQVQATLRPVADMLQQRHPGIQRCEQAFARPHMTFSCRPHIDAKCHPLNGLGCHALNAARILDSPLPRREHEPSTTRLNAMIAKDAEFAASASTLIGQTLALAQLRETTEVVTWLGARRADALVGLDIEALRRADVDPKLAAIGEYLLASSAIDMLASDTTQGGWLFDEGDTRRRLNMAFSPAQSGNYGAVALPPRGVWWWWDNPVGQQALQVLAMSGPVFDMINSRRAELNALRAKLPAPANRPSPQP